MLKIDLHIHTADDPVDRIPYTTLDLIARAAELQFDAVAVTLHDRQLDIRDLTDFARARGILLIPGVERTIRGRHLLLINFPEEAESLQSFEDVEALKRRHPEGLVIAPHPFFPHSNCLRGWSHDLVDLFDAVEVNAFYTSALDFNRAAVKFAGAHGKPLVGNSDAHRLPTFGMTYSLVQAELNAAAICTAIRSGQVLVETTPLSPVEATKYCFALFAGGRRSAEKTADRCEATA
jgi:predicted metal-dependent phosphoesterase TrpH